MRVKLDLAPIGDPGDFSPIALLSRAEFDELRESYRENDDGTGFPSLSDALEIMRRRLHELLHNTPIDDISPNIRGKLATLADIATWALVEDRAARAG